MLCICMLCVFCSSCPVALSLFGACFPDSSLGKGVMSEGSPDSVMSSSVVTQTKLINPSYLSTVFQTSPQPDKKSTSCQSLYQCVGKLHFLLAFYE